MAITKQQFLSALECDTRGWRDVHAVAGPIPPGLTWQFHEGQQVHAAARAWLAGLNPSTRFEVTFTADDCIARADAVREVPGGIEVIEVKSGTVKADDKFDKNYIKDLAYTVAVAQASGLAVSKAGLVLLNGEYVEGESRPLLRHLDVTGDVLGLATGFRDSLADIAEVLTGEMPASKWRFECRNCDHFGNSCEGVGLDHPLFEIPRLSRKRFDGISQFREIADLPDNVDLTAIQLSHVDVVKSGEPRADKAELAKLAELSYPLLYLDFEAVQPALPWYEGMSPYQKVPFQFSLHVQHAAGRELEHHEFLAPASGDHRRQLAESLLQLLGDNGTIVVYSNYEEQIFKALAKAFPDLESALTALVPRVFDLHKIVKSGYQHPDFHGSTSIKKVLPVMTQSSGYQGMDVSGGLDAAAIFALMWVGKYPPETHDEHRKHLLEYCKLDTQAMVDVKEGLDDRR